MYFYTVYNRTETKTAWKYEIQPDMIIGCAGGGSNFGGLIAPYGGQDWRKKNWNIAVEPASCPSLTRGKFAYDFGDTGKTTPLMKMYTLGSGFIPLRIMREDEIPRHESHYFQAVQDGYWKPGLLSKPRSLKRLSLLPAAKAPYRLRNQPMP